MEKYGVDPVRYFLLRELPSTEDGDFSYKKLEERYNGDLANGLGNLVRRVATLIENNMDGELIYKKEEIDKLSDEDKSPFEGFLNDSDYHGYINNFELHRALENIFTKISIANKFIDDRKPWVEVKESPERFLITMTVLTGMIHHITWLLRPFIPETAQKIADTFGDDLSNKEIPEDYHFKVKKGEPLFPRLTNG